MWDNMNLGKKIWMGIAAIVCCLMIANAFVPEDMRIYCISGAGALIGLLMLTMPFLMWHDYREREANLNSFKRSYRMFTHTDFSTQTIEENGVRRPLTPEEAEEMRKHFAAAGEHMQKAMDEMSAMFNGTRKKK